MHLSKIEVVGFKSFAQKVELQFNKGITAIIGPNGSGKSNIVDAVRWVLGEQSAKTLRGARMEDIIFNGTEDRKPQAYCEVSLTIDNSDGQLGIGYTEINVARRLYRSGESEYLINRAPVRLKDVVDLFRDTGIGTDGYSIIGQGKVNEILSTKSDERRGVLEEAAGVTRYKARRDEAVRKLDNTQANLTRIEDIIAELFIQMDTLSAQRDTAVQYLSLRDALKEIELNAFLRQYESMQNRMAGGAATHGQISDELAQASEREALLQDERRAKSAELRAKEAEITQMQHALLSLGGSVEKQEGEAKVLREKAEGLLRENAGHEERIAQYGHSRAEGEKQRNTCCDLLAVKTKECEASAGKLELAEAELAQATAQLAGLEEAYEQRKTAAMEYMNRMADAKSALARLGAMKGAVADRKAALAQDMARLAKEQGELEADRQSAQQEYDEASRRTKEKSRELADLGGRNNEIAARLNSFADNMRASMREADMLRSRINVLGEMKKAREGYYESVRRLLGDAERNPLLGQGIIGVVGDIISVPSRLDVAVESALGSALQNIVTVDENAAKRGIEHLKRNNYGRATFLPVTAIRSRTLTREERATLNRAGVEGVASELLSFDAKYRGIVENLLGRVVIVADMDSGIALAKANGNAFRIVTTGGDLINVGGSMTGGSLGKREISLLGRDREMTALAEKLARLESEIAGGDKTEQELKTALARLEDDIASAGGQLRILEIDEAKYYEKAETVQILLGKSQEQLDRLRLEDEQLDETLADIEDQLGEAGRQSQGERITQEELAREHEVITALRRRRESVMERATEQKVAAASLRREISSLEGDAMRLEKENLQLKTRQGEARAAIEQNLAAIADLQRRFAEITGSNEEERQALNERREELQNAEQDRDALQEYLARQEEKLSALQAAVNGYVDRLHKLEVQHGRLEVELENLQNRIWEDYELTYEGAKQYRSDVSLSESTARTEELKAMMRELGEVNVRAIEDYKNVKMRYDSLIEQKQDLTKAQADLTKMIDELMKTMEAQFKRQFDIINENFSGVFKKLFGGGRAEMRLTDAKNVLGCDIEITAQPPGKRLQHLSLLSGGEMALTAIALLFAILKLKPTPFCLLDEIESSLDEANVVNFTNYIRQYSENTQFIMITHRKGSMECCDTLYGVAMEEKGVSRLVSVRMADYKSLTA